MSQLQIKTIQIFDSIVFLDCIYNQIEQRVGLSFKINNNCLSLFYGPTNQFLSFYKFNNLSIEKFILQLINNTAQDKTIIVTEDSIPF